VALDNRSWTLKDAKGAPIAPYVSLGVCGPAVPVEISLPSDQAKKIAAAGQVVPASVVGFALIDTGASASCVDVSVGQKLGLSAINQLTVHTPSGLDKQSVFAVRMDFPGGRLAALDPWFVLGSQLASLGVIPGAPLVALLGRDYLGGRMLVYNGPMGGWLIAE